MAKIDEIYEDNSIFTSREKSLQRRALSAGAFIALPMALGIVDSQGKFISSGGVWINSAKWIHSKYSDLVKTMKEDTVNPIRSGDKAQRVLEEHQTSFGEMKDRLKDKLDKKRQAGRSTGPPAPIPSPFILNPTQMEEVNWMREWAPQLGPDIKPGASGLLENTIFRKDFLKLNKLEGNLVNILNAKDIPQKGSTGFTSKEIRRYHKKAKYKDALKRYKRLSAIQNIGQPGVMNSLSKFALLQSALAFTPFDSTASRDPHKPSSHWVKDPTVSVFTEGDILTEALQDDGFAYKFNNNLKMLVHRYIYKGEGFDKESLNKQYAAAVRKGDRTTAKQLRKALKRFPTVSGYDLSPSRAMSDIYNELEKEGLPIPKELGSTANTVLDSSSSLSTIEHAISSSWEGLDDLGEVPYVGVYTIADLQQLDKARYEAAGLTNLYEATLSPERQAKEIKKMLGVYTQEIQDIKNTALKLRARMHSGDESARAHLEYEAQKTYKSGAIGTDSVDAYLNFVDDMTVEGKLLSTKRGAIPFKTFSLTINMGGQKANINVPLAQFGLMANSGHTRLSNTFLTLPFMKDPLQSNAVEASIQAIQQYTKMSSKLITDIRDNNYRISKFERTVARMWGQYREMAGPTEGVLKDFLAVGRLNVDSFKYLSGDEHMSFYKYMSRGVQGLKTAQQIDQLDVPVVALDFEFNNTLEDRATGVQKSMQSGRNKAYWASYTVKVGDSEEIFDHFIRPENWNDIREHAKNFHVKHQQDTGHKTFEEIDAALKNAQNQWETLGVPKSQGVKAVINGRTSTTMSTTAGYLQMAKNIYKNSTGAVYFVGHNVIEADLVMLNSELKGIIEEIESGIFEEYADVGIKPDSEDLRLLKRLFKDTKMETLIANGRVMDTISMAKAALGDKISDTRFGLQDLFETLVSIKVSEGSRLTDKKGLESWFVGMKDAIEADNKDRIKDLIGELPTSAQGGIKRFIQQQSKSKVLDFFDASKGTHHAPFYDHRLAMSMVSMLGDSWDELERYNPVVYNELVRAGKIADQMVNGERLGWHHRLSVRKDHDVLAVDESLDPNDLRSHLASVTPIQAKEGIGSVFDIKQLTPFGALSNIQKQKYQGLTSKLQPADYVEQVSYDSLKEMRVPGAFPIIGERMVNTIGLSTQEEFMETFASLTAGKKGTRFRHSFPAQVMYLPDGSRLVAEDQALFANRKIMKATFNLNKSISAPLSIKLPQIDRLLNKSNMKNISLFEYMRAAGFSDRLLESLQEGDALPSDMSLASFIEASSMPVYSHDEAIDKLISSTEGQSHKGVLKPRDVLVNEQSKVSSKYKGDHLVRIQAKVKNKLKREAVITDLRWNSNTGEIIFDTVSAGTSNIVKLTASNKMNKGMVHGYAANEFVGKGIQLIAGWSTDSAGMLDTQLRRVLKKLHRSGASVSEQKRELTSMFSKAFNLAPEDVNKVFQLDTVSVYKGQSTLFGSDGNIVIPKLKDQSVLNLQHSDVMRNVRVMLEEAQLTFEDVRKNFKELFTDISEDIGVSFSDGDVDRLADMLVDSQKKQINDILKLNTKYKADSNIYRWAIEAQKAIKSNVAVFDIGATIQRSQIKSRVLDYVRDQKLQGTFNRDDKILPLFDENGNFTKGSEDFLTLESIAFIIPQELQVMEDSIDFGRMKGTSTDIWGNVTESASSTWQMMMFKQSAQDNPLFEKTFVENMLSKTGWSDPVIVNRLKSNYYVMGTVFHGLDGAYEGGDMPAEVSERLLGVAKGSVHNKENIRKSWKVLQEDVNMFKTLMGEFSNPKAKEILGDIRQLYGTSIDQIVDILSEAGVHSSAIQLQDEMDELYGGSIRSFGTDPQDIFQTFQAPSEGAGVVSFVVPDAREGVENLTSGEIYKGLTSDQVKAKKAFLDEIQKTQVVQTSRARLVREINSAIKEYATDGEISLIDKQTEHLVKQGRMHKDLLNLDVSLSELPESLRGSINKIVMADVLEELPPFMQDNSKYMLVGPSYAKLKSGEHIVNNMERLSKIATEVAQGKKTHEEAIAAVTDSYKQMVGGIATMFTKAAPTSISQTLHKASMFYSPSQYGKALDASTIMTQGFGGLVDELMGDSSKFASDMQLTRGLRKYLGKNASVTYVDYISNITGAKNITGLVTSQLQDVLYTDVKGKRFLRPKGAGLTESIISQSELVRQLNTAENLTASGKESPLSYLLNDRKELLKVLSGESPLYSELQRQPSFPSPIGSIMTRSTVVPDEVFGKMGITAQETLGGVFSNRLELLAMLGDLDGDLVRQMFLDAEQAGILKISADEIADGFKSQMGKIDRFISTQMGEDGTGTFQAGSTNQAVYTEYEGRYIFEAHPEGLSDNGFMKMLKKMDDPFSALSSEVRAETYAVMQALTPRIGGMTKNMNTLFVGDRGGDPGARQVLRDIKRRLSSSNLDDVKEFLISHEGTDTAIEGLSEGQVRAKAEKVKRSYTGAWDILESTSNTFYKDHKKGITIDKSFTNRDLFNYWWRTGITQKGPIAKAKSTSLDNFIEWEGFVNKFFQGSVTDDAVNDLIGYATSSRNAVQKTRYDLMGVTDEATDYMTAEESALVRKSLTENANDTLKAALQMLHGFRITSKDAPLSNAFELSKGAPSGIYGWAVDYFTDDNFIKPELSKLIAPEVRLMVANAETAAEALMESVVDGFEHKGVTERMTNAGRKMFDTIAKTRWGKGLALSTLAFTAFDPNANSILLPDQQYDGEKHDIPNIQEVARSYKNRLRVREQKASTLDKLAHIAGLPTDFMQREVTHPGLPPRPEQPRHTHTRNKRRSVLSLNDLRRQINNIVYET